MGGFRSIDDLGTLEGRRVLVRVDFNVPVVAGRITDTSRIEAAIPTIKALLSQGARVILISHFGRPGGQANAGLSLANVVETLAEISAHAVEFIAAPIGHGAGQAVEASTAPLMLLENVRFYPGEITNDPAFADQLAAVGDAFVNDAFSAAHRAHASTVGLATRLPSAAGLAMIGELDVLEATLGSPERPVAAVVGGAKVSTKLAVFENLVHKVDHLIIGGGMANTFLAALGRPVGASLCEHDMSDKATAIIAEAESAGSEIHLPAEVVVAKALEANIETEIKPTSEVAADDMILDIGPASVEQLIDILKNCRTLVWNGPLGAFEVPPFDQGTKALALAAADLTAAGRLLSVAGGGDTLAALKAAGVEGSFTHISTAGGAFLDWMAGCELPAAAALRADG
jgi:phosphoglycerate kinase